MNRFELLKSTDVYVSRVRPGREKGGGNDKKPVVELDLLVELPNSALTMFDPTLKAALYVNASKGPKQQTLESVEPVSDAPNLRFPKAGKLKWGVTLSGYKLSIGGLIGGRTDLVLEECTLDRFTIDPKEGGTTKVTFRAVTSHVDKKEFGELGVLTFRTVSVLLMGPALVEEIDKAPTAGQRSKAALDASGKSPFPKGGAKTDAEIKGERSDAIVSKLVGENGKAKAPAKKTAVKYRDDETGDTWSGKGLQPAWLKARLANGRKLEAYDMEAKAKANELLAAARGGATGGAAAAH